MAVKVKVKAKVAAKGKAPAKAKAPVKAKAKAAPKRELVFSGRPTGTKHGLSVSESWAYFLRENEKRPAGQKWTDEDIARMHRAEFPERAKIWDKAGKDPADVHGVRRWYNATQCTKAGEPPKRLSKGYARNGTVLDTGVGRGTTPASKAPAASSQKTGKGKPVVKVATRKAVAKPAPAKGKAVAAKVKPRVVLVKRKAA
jgi:hypothetical protein